MKRNETIFCGYFYWYRCTQIFIRYVRFCFFFEITVVVNKDEMMDRNTLVLTKFLYCSTKTQHNNISIVGSQRQIASRCIIFFQVGRFYFARHIWPLQYTHKITPFYYIDRAHPVKVEQIVEHDVTVVRDRDSVPLCVHQIVNRAFVRLDGERGQKS